MGERTIVVGRRFRGPDMGGGTELVFVEGHSRDDTFAAIEHEMAAWPERAAEDCQATSVASARVVIKTVRFIDCPSPPRPRWAA